MIKTYATTQHSTGFGTDLLILHEGLSEFLAFQISCMGYVCVCVCVCVCVTLVISWGFHGMFFTSDVPLEVPVLANSNNSLHGNSRF